MADKNATATLDVDERPWKRGLRKAAAEFGKFEKKIKGMKKKFKDFSIGGLGVAAGITAIGVAIGYMIKSAAQVETATTQFAVLTGSVQSAKKHIDDLVSFTAKTPFQFQGVAASSRILQSFGIKVDEVQPRLKLIGDIAAASGNNLRNVATIYGQIASLDALEWERTKQLSERGIPVMAMMKKELGATGEELRKLMSKKKISTKLFLDMFHTMNKDGKFAFDGMKKLSESVAGKFSTLKDNIWKAASMIGDHFMPAIKRALTTANKFFDIVFERKEVETAFFKQASEEQAEAYKRARSSLFGKKTTEEFRQFRTEYLEKKKMREAEKEEQEATFLSDQERAAEKAKINAILKKEREKEKKKEDAAAEKEEKKKIAKRKEVLTEMTAMQDSNNKVLAGMGKAAALANIAIDTQRMAMSWAAWGGNPFFSAILGAAAIAWGAERAAAVAGIQLKEGGTVMGRMGASPYQDAVPARLQIGETVISKRLTDSLSKNADSPPVQQIDQSTKVIVQGNVMADDDQQVDNFIERINERVESYGARLVASDSQK